MMKRNRRIKKPDAPSKLVPTEIVGLTTKNANGLASSSSSSSCAYIAGCVAVIYDVNLGKQSHLLVSHRMPKPLSCVAMSCDGGFVAAGEVPIDSHCQLERAHRVGAKSGRQPAVLVWDCSTLALVSELKGHIYGVDCVAFSPDGEHLLSVGKYIYIWEWRNGRLITKLNGSSHCFEATSAIFSSDKKFIVTACKKHLRFWTVGISPRTRTSKGVFSVAKQGKPINLCPQKGSSFVSVTSASCTNHGSELSAIYAMTDAGVLCLIDSGFLRKSIDLKVEKGFALSATTRLVACACSNGMVQLFTTGVLEYVAVLPYSKAKNTHNDPVSENPHKENIQSSPNLPDAVACQFTTAEKLVVVYGDHSLYVWDIHDVNKASRCCVLVSHSACIWDVKNLFCENMHDPSLVCAARGCSGGVSFATCSADGTIRLWDLVLQTELSEDGSEENCSVTRPLRSVCLVSAGIFARDIVGPTFSNLEFRSMAVSTDGKYMSAGDCDGNIHIYDLQDTNYTFIKDAHEAEILSLSFNMSSKVGINSAKSTNSQYILASGGRDEKVHLYDVQRNFDLIGSIDDHSAAVTSVKLPCDGCMVLSCSADRSLVFRDINITESGCEVISHERHTASQGTVYDMAIDPTMEVVVTVDQDKKINIFDISSRKLIQSFNQYKDFGDPLKVTMDPSCSYLVCLYANKSICMYDFATGEMIAQGIGHGEVVTGVIFLPDCKHIVSVGGDSCIILWKLPAHLTSRMLLTAKENPVSLSPGILTGEKGHTCRTHKRYALSSESLDHEPYLEKDSQQTSSFKLSISRLPKWAQNKVGTSDFIRMKSELTSLQDEQVKQEIFSPTIGNIRSSASANCEDQSPFAHDIGTSNLCLSSLYGSTPRISKSISSGSQQKIIRSFSKQKQWLTIYTVMSDLLSSPELLNTQDVAEATKLSADVHELPGECGHTFANDKTLVQKHACPCSIDYQGKGEDQIKEEKKSGSEGIPDDPGKSYLHESRLQDLKDVNSCQINSEESGLFNDHFGSLSISLKIDKRKASSSRRYTGQYFLSQDQHGGYRKIFITPAKNQGLLKHDKGSENDVISEDPASKFSEERGRAGCDGQWVRGEELEDAKDVYMDAFCEDDSDAKDVYMGVFCEDESNSLTFQQKSSQAEPMEEKDEKQCVSGENQTHERIAACSKALVDLEAAASNVFQLVTELEHKGSGADTEPQRGAELAQLYDQAAALLPLVAEKVSSIAKAMQISRENACAKE